MYVVQVNKVTLGGARGRNDGTATLELADRASVELAITLSGSELKGRRFDIRVLETTPAATGGGGGGGDRRGDGGMGGRRGGMGGGREHHDGDRREYRSSHHDGPRRGGPEDDRHIHTQARNAGLPARAGVVSGGGLHAYREGGIHSARAAAAVTTEGSSGAPAQVAPVVVTPTAVVSTERRKLVLAPRTVAPGDASAPAMVETSGGGIFGSGKAQDLSAVEKFKKEEAVVPQDTTVSAPPPATAAVSKVEGGSEVAVAAPRTRAPAPASSGGSTSHTYGGAHTAAARGGATGSGARGGVASRGAGTWSSKRDKADKPRRGVIPEAALMEEAKPAVTTNDNIFAALRQDDDSDDE